MEPDRESPSSVPRRRWAFALAVAVAALLAWVAPSDWSTGPGAIEVRYLGDVAMVVPIEFGSAEAVEADDRLGLVAVDLRIPEGVAAGETVDVDVRVDDPARTESLADIEVELITPDGVRELVPMLESDDGWFHGSRRPVNGSAVVLAVLGAAMVLWVSEAVPLFVTSLAIPVALAVADIGTASETLAPFFDPIIVLFFGGFLMAEAMQRAGLDRLAAVTIVDVAGAGPIRLYVTLLCLSAFLSMWMSNTRP